MSEEQKHTPGPFTVGKTCVGIPAIFAAGSNTAIAMFGARSGDQLSLLPNHKANLNLFAAAPDMLAALEKLDEMRKDFLIPDDELGAIDGDSIRAFVEMYRAAITKAKGAQ